MILSKKNNFLFLKTKKTAGTSIEIFLSSYCGKRDIITPITPIDELTRLHEGRICQNFHSDKEVEDRYRRTYLALNPSMEPQEQIRRLPEKIPPDSLYWNHMAIGELTKIIPDVSSDHYFKFCIERHPYEKAVSLANMSVKFSSYQQGGDMNISSGELKEAIGTLIESRRIQNIRNYDIYTTDGVVRVDKVVDYALLQDELKSVLQRMDLSINVELPFTKVGGRNKKINAEQLLTDKQKEVILELCREEFELMHYER